MSSRDNVRVKEGTDSLPERKRHIYMLCLLFAVLIFHLSWISRGARDAFVEILYPVFALIAILFLILLWLKIFSLRKMEPVLLVVLSAMILGRLAWLFHTPGPLDERLLLLAGGHYWSVGALVVGAFVMLDNRWGPVIGTIIILMSIAIAASAVIAGMLDNMVSADTLVYLIRIHIFLFLLMALTSAVAALREDLQRALDNAGELDHIAHTDTLTSIANRRVLERFLDKQVAAASAHGRPFSVIIADLDNFKHINDSHGHTAGDAVLVEAAHIFTRLLRDTDFVGRWGGDEFIIAAPATDGEKARILAERIRRRIAEEHFSEVGHITISFGIAEIRPGESSGSLVKRADDAMYRAKLNGRNQVVLG